MGNGSRKNAGKHAARRGAIVHNELAASARFVTFDVPERDFPGNRSLAGWKFVCRPKENLRARRRALPATITPLTASI
jgi:hypothetical protein